MDDCLCNTGYYDAIEGTGVNCLTCPVGTSCELGSTLANMPLKPAFFRLNNATVDVQACPDMAAKCVSQATSSEPSRPPR